MVIMPAKGTKKKNVKKSRKSKITRETKETDISIELNLDGTGEYDIETDVNFFTHMLILLSRHAGIDLKIRASGDLGHHMIEDVGICFGKALYEALGDKKGIQRYGDKTLPMDETLATCALDLGGRSYHKIDLKFQGRMIEDCNSEDLIHFFESCALNANINLHIFVHYGENEHHKAEAAFKSFAHALKESIKIIGDQIPSTKGVLE